MEEGKCQWGPISEHEMNVEALDAAKTIVEEVVSSSSSSGASSGAFPVAVAVAVVGFDHTKGNVVERSSEDELTESDELAFSALPDGAHHSTAEDDYCFLRVRGRTREWYGVSCVRQVKDETLKRGHVQKALCLLAEVPAYGALLDEARVEANHVFEDGLTLDTALKAASKAATLALARSRQTLTTSPTSDVGCDSLIDRLGASETWRLLKALLLERSVIVVGPEKSTKTASETALGLAAALPYFAEPALHRGARESVAETRTPEERRKSDAGVWYVGHLVGERAVLDPTISIAHLASLPEVRRPGDLVLCGCSNPHLARTHLAPAFSTRRPAALVVVPAKRRLFENDDDDVHHTAAAAAGPLRGGGSEQQQQEEEEQQEEQQTEDDDGGDPKIAAEDDAFDGNSKSKSNSAAEEGDDSESSFSSSEIKPPSRSSPQQGLVGSVFQRTGGFLLQQTQNLQDWGKTSEWRAGALDGAKQQVAMLVQQPPPPKVTFYCAPQQKDFESYETRNSPPSASATATVGGGELSSPESAQKGGAAPCDDAPLGATWRPTKCEKELLEAVDEGREATPEEARDEWCRRALQNLVSQMIADVGTTDPRDVDAVADLVDRWDGAFLYAWLTSTRNGSAWADVYAPAWARLVPRRKELSDLLRPNLVAKVLQQTSNAAEHLKGRAERLSQETHLRTQTAKSWLANAASAGYQASLDAVERARREAAAQPPKPSTSPQALSAWYSSVGDVVSGAASFATRRYETFRQNDRPSPAGSPVRDQPTAQNAPVFAVDDDDDDVTDDDKPGGGNGNNEEDEGRPNDLEEAEENKEKDSASAELVQETTTTTKEDTSAATTTATLPDEELPQQRNDDAPSSP